MLQCKTKWKKKKLENLSEMQKGKLTAQGLFCNENWIKLLNTETLFSKIETYADTKNAVISTDKDVLILCDGERSGLVAKGQHGVVGSTFAKLSIDNSEIDSNYLYHFMSNKFTWIQNRRTGTGVPHIPKDLSHILEIEYPKDITEQKKFADILSTCDEVIEKTEETIEKYKQIKAGMMQDLFNCGLDSNGKLRPTYAQAPDLYKYSKLLDRYIPTEWEADKLDNLFTYTVGGDVDKPCFSEYKTSLHKYPIFANAVDNEGLYGYSSKFVIDSPAITIAGRGVNVGTVFYRDAFFTPIVRLVVAFPNECLNILFASIALSRIKFESEATGIPQLTVPMVKKYKMAYPKNKEEQQNIYKYLHKIDLKLEKEEQYLNKYKQIKQGLMKRLLTPPADAEIVEE